MHMVISQALIYQIVGVLINLLIGVLFMVFSLRIPSKDKMSCVDKDLQNYNNRVDTMKWYGFTIGLLFLLTAVGWFLSFFMKV